MYAWHETWNTTLFLYILVLIWLKLKTIVVCLKLRAKLRFEGFLSVFCAFSHKLVHILFFWHVTCHTIYLVHIFVLKLLELKTLVKCFKLRVKLRFKGFLSVLGTFSFKVVQTSFFSHATWPTILFGIYYSVEMVRS